MAVTRSKASKHLLTGNMAVDVLGASPQLRQFEVNLTTSGTMCVNGATKYLQCVSGTTSGIKVTAAYVTFAVAPVMASGTSTLGIDRVATDGSTSTVIVTAASVLSGYTAFIPVAQTLAATNPSAITAGQTIRVTVTTSSNTVDTADVNCTVTLVCEHIEDTTISDSNTNTANT